jgi:large subunit ribosomal protein L3
MSLSNSLGLLGRKVGMMRLFTDDGDAVPVTVVDVSNNRVTQIKSQETDGYVALQVTFGSRKASRVTKPEAGHLAKAGVEAGEIIQEFRVTADTAGQHKAGGVIAAASVFRGQRSTCKAPRSARASQHDQAPQQLAARSAATAVRTTCPARMARIEPCSRQAHDGPPRRRHRDHQNLDVIRIDEARQLLLIKGAIPGSKGGFVTVRPAVKAKPQR